MRFISEVIIVEGRYDKNTVSQAVNATILETSGFRIFSDKEKIAVLRELARVRGLIILADSDRGGFFIRGRLNSLLGNENIKHAYIPDIEGRERRKREASKEGKLGVEGMSPEVIIKALERAGATFIDEPPKRNSDVLITKSDLYSAGLYGGDNSAVKRRQFMKRLGLPERLSTKGLLEVLNTLYTIEEFNGFTEPGCS